MDPLSAGVPCLAKSDSTSVKVVSGKLAVCEGVFHTGIDSISGAAKVAETDGCAEVDGTGAAGVVGVETVGEEAASDGAGVFHMGMLGSEADKAV